MYFLSVCLFDFFLCKDTNIYLFSQTRIYTLLCLHRWWAKVASVLILWTGVSVAPCRRPWTWVLAGTGVGSKTRPCVENRVNVVIVVKCVLAMETLGRAGTVGLFFSRNFSHWHNFTETVCTTPPTNYPYNCSQYVPVYHTNVKER
jgi:hypothetical protein